MQKREINVFYQIIVPMLFVALNIAIYFGIMLDLKQNSRLELLSIAILFWVKIILVVK